MVEVAEMGGTEAMDTASPAAGAGAGSESGAGAGAGAAMAPDVPDMPAAFPKKRRGRPPGRPNMTVREADYEENPLVQAWNAAKPDRAMTVVPIAIREALTEKALVHDTQRAIFGLPSREIIYFVQGWITARHIASQRPSYVNGLLIHSRGQDAPSSCLQCAERRDKNALGPFLTCRILMGSYHNSCSNCKWFDNTSTCSLYTGPKPNRKRKAKEPAAAENSQLGDANSADATIAPEEYLQQPGEVHDRPTPDDGIDPSLHEQVGVGLDHQRVSEEAHYSAIQAESDMNAVDAHIAAQLLPEIERQDGLSG
ncbi:hypothetical protein B0T25DRAFT_304227 [Lasiosphaeria hispida]|uniref:Uncharacterized protein n=1 Tax=Lasiosphaeria hispida TaxID=260671 RepID=A0AAJ0H953_9PEZI|nr:hypothetical protein B0T25DRAFT_304227 [Lasiosphaeria hispida]